MRFTTTSLLASILIGAAGCAASGASSAPGDGNTPQDPGSTNVPGDATEPAEKPLAPRAVCETVATDSYFGQSCSGSASGQDVCAFDSYSCGENSCVYDSRREGAFAFFCAPSCNPSDTSVSCPLGYECIAPDASCGGDVHEGVCTRRVDFACDDVGDASGTFLEGPGGALLALKWTGSQGSLREKTKTGWRTLTTWSETSGSGYVYGTARVDDRMLIVTSTYELLVEGGTATATKRSTGATSSTPAVGVAADGSFVSLETSGNSYATLSRRGADGKWTEIGPTRKRIASLGVLGRGFVARCGEDLCTSADGEAFDAVALPPGVTLTDTSSFVAAGASHEDFYIANEGRLFHHRKGKWVEEGPRGTPDSSGYSSRSDALRISATGTVAFFTWNGTAYTTFTTTDDGECWKTTTANNLNAATLAGDSFTWVSSGYGDLCSLRID